MKDFVEQLSSSGNASETYAIDEIENDPHSNAKLLKVQIAVIVDVGKVPDPLELVIAQLAVFENGGCLVAGQVGTTVGQGGEDLPISLDFPLFDLLVGHDIQGKESAEKEKVTLQCQLA